MRLPERQLRKLLYWMEERQRIYLKRKAGERYPWTKDPILQKIKFCNVYREQDRVTVWLRDNWLKPYKDHPNLWFACALFRQINWPPTLDAIGFPEVWEPNETLKILRKRAAAGEKNYTSAYMLNASTSGGHDKPYYTVKQVLNPLWKNTCGYGSSHEHLPRSTLEKATQWFTQFHGFGGFLAYEVVTDLRHTRYLRNAPDIHTWANPGNGARRGMNRIFKREVDDRPSQDQLLDEMRRVYLWIHKERDRKVLPTLEMRDIEHSACEFDKYCRIQQGTGANGKGSRAGLEHFHPPEAYLVP